MAGPVGPRPAPIIERIANEFERRQMARREGQVDFFDLTPLVPRKRSHLPGTRYLRLQVHYEGQVGGGDNGNTAHYRLWTAEQPYLLHMFTFTKQDNLGADSAVAQAISLALARGNVLTNYLTVEELASGLNRDLGATAAVGYVGEGDAVYFFVDNAVANHVFNIWLHMTPVDEWDRAPIVPIHLYQDRAIAAVPAVGTNAALLMYDSHRRGSLGTGAVIP